MLADLAADGTHRQPGKAASAAGAEDEKIGVLRSVDQNLGRVVRAPACTLVDGAASPRPAAALAAVSLAASRAWATTS